MGDGIGDTCGGRSDVRIRVAVSNEPLAELNARAEAARGCYINLDNNDAEGEGKYPRGEGNFARISVLLGGLNVDEKEVLT
ncbi:Hypothetical protein NTJ_12659 [Nesidiocoris tenuis]|uniref:Uncharacterized protein n=1 Tax=Nesidiocoris tenuis TaxID=355587 RepID=A0ABN7B854_9HEMI|nr:Hypothetical protein NTJ_12659 [Nesidiocoris tenuis]